MMNSAIDKLWQAGYIVKSKVGTIAGDSYKCDFDVEMTMDISRIAYVNAPDVVVLVSGDSDFIPVVLELRGRGIRVEVASFEVAMSRHLALKSSGFINPDALIDKDADENYPQAVRDEDGFNQPTERENDNAETDH